MTNTLKIVARALLLQVILFVLSYLSHKLGTVTNSLLLYLPLVLGIVFIHWFGAQILPVLFINGVTTLFIWGVSKFTLKIGVLSTHEAIVALVSWLLYQKLFLNKSSPRFENTNSFLRFVVLGIVIPVCVNSIYVYHYGFVRGNVDKVVLYWLSDFITILPVSVLLLYFFDFNASTNRIQPIARKGLSRQEWIELGIITVVFIALSLYFPFDKYWFIYGIGATLFALRWGFEASILLNLVIFMLSYLLPLFDFASSLLITQGSTQYANVHLGMSTMMFVSMLVGRVVSDLGEAEKKLKNQKQHVEKINNELQETNQELDRFVYSVSHDLSAPLKSIKGLVTISRMEPQQANEYLTKIDRSVDRLEEFISEVLDYSRTNRKQLVYENIELRQFIEEINCKFEFLEQFFKIDFRYDLKITSLNTDRFLLRVALSNILSNAIKYQKKFEAHKPFVSIRSRQENGFSIIEIEDNGEGIKEEYRSKLFNMFYRGTVSSSGSGLGLYIAREAAQKLNGEITVRSAWGEGSTFSVIIPV